MQTRAQQAGHDFSTGDYVERDRKGNETYWETSDGYWVKHEYDDKGNRTYLEDSTGFWVKREYDARGKVISTESGKKSLKKVAQ